MVNIVTVTPNQARANAILFLRCQDFYQKNYGAKKEAITTLNGLTFTLFTASRHVVLNSGEFERFASQLEPKERRRLYEEALGKRANHGVKRPLAEPSYP